MIQSFSLLPRPLKEPNRPEPEPEPEPVPIQSINLLPFYCTLLQPPVAPVSPHLCVCFFFKKNTKLLPSFLPCLFRLRSAVLLPSLAYPLSLSLSLFSSLLSLSVYLPSPLLFFPRFLFSILPQRLFHFSIESTHRLFHNHFTHSLSYPFHSNTLLLYVRVSTSQTNLITISTPSPLPLPTHATGKSSSSTIHTFSFNHLCFYY